MKGRQSMKGSQNSPTDGWEASFVLEARARDFTGDAIGSALEEIRSHCMDSGESAEEAFGDPTRYAASLDLRKESPATVGILLSGLLGLLALVLIPESVSALRAGRDASLTMGQLIAMGTTSCLMVIVVLRGSQVYRALGRSGALRGALLFTAGFAVLVASQVALMFLFPSPVQLNSTAMVIAGLLALLGNVVLSLQQIRHGGSDALTSPLKSAPKQSRIAVLATVLVWPAICLIFTLVALTR